MKNSNNKKQISKKKLLNYIACGSFIGITAIGSAVGVVIAQHNKETNITTKNLNNTANITSISSHNINSNNVKNSVSNNGSIQNISSSPTNFVQKYQNAKTVVDQFIKNTNIDPNSNSFKNGFSSGIEELINSPQFLKSVLNKNQANNNIQDSQIKSVLNNLKNSYGSTTTSTVANTTANKIINSTKKTSFTNLFSVGYEVRQILNNGITALSNLSLELSNEKMGLEISSGILAAVLGVLGFCDAGTTVIIATVIGTIMKFACSAIATAIGALNSDVAKMQVEINDASRLLNLSDTLTTINQSIQSCLSAINSSIHKLKDYIWIIGVSKAISKLQNTYNQLLNTNTQTVNDFNTIIRIQQADDFNTTVYMQDAILNWITSNQNVLNSQDSSFSDLVRQNMVGYQILNNPTDFDNFKVSFTKLPSKDASALGSLADNYWLTITATARQTINFTDWNVYNGWWNTNIVESVGAGTIFTWTLPYALTGITLSNSQLSMNVNNTYDNAVNNENLPVPFGLSIGNSSNLTSISSTWTSNYNGVLATNYGTYDEDYSLPSTWSVAFNQDNAAANLLNAQIQENISNLGYTNENSTTFLNNLINEWMIGFKLNASASDFTNWHASWAPSEVNGYKVLELSAYSTNAIQPQYWDQALYGGYGGGQNMDYTIPANSYFTWTLPYYEGGVSVQNSILSLKEINGSYYYNSYAGLSLWNTPLGLSIGSSSTNPNSISSNSWFSGQYLSYSDSDTSKNGVIGIGYASYNTTPDLTFSTSWVGQINPITSSSTNSSSTYIPVVANVNENLNNININNILSEDNITSLSSYLNQYQSANFEEQLINDLSSTTNTTITKISYSSTNINSITVRNNSNEIVHLYYDGNEILTLNPEQVGTANLNISLINWSTFGSDNSNLNLTVLWHDGNKGAVDYFNQMWCYNGKAVYDMAAIYGFLSTNITSQSAYNNFGFNDYGDGYTTLVTSSSWTTYYDSRYSAQTIKLAWMADILGINANGFEGYGVYVQNASNIVINQVEYNGVWYAVNYNINLGGRFCLNWYFW